MAFWLYVLLLSLHLAAMNVAGGAPLASVWLEWRERRGSPIVRASADYLALAALVSLLVGMLLGLGLVAVRWSPDFVGVWGGPLSRKLLWGVAELVFSLLLAVGYVLWRRKSPQPGAVGRGVRLLLPLLSGTNLLYHFPALFLVASHLTDEGAVSGAALTAKEFRHLMVAGTTPAMIVHVALASVASAGIALLGLALRWQRQQRPSEEINALSRGAAWLALAPTVLQVFVGLWILVTLEGLTQSRILGGDLLSAVCLLCGVLGAFWLMQLLAAFAFGDMDRTAAIKSMAIFFAVILFMTTAWHAARHLGRAKPAERAAHKSIIRQAV